MMKIFLISILLFTLFITSCSLFEEKIPSEAFPEQVGVFKRETLGHSTAKSMSATYYKLNVPDPGRIWLSIRLAKSVEEANENWLSECSDEPPFVNLNELLLKSELRSKSGKIKGIIKICKRTQDDKTYFLEMSNDKLAVRIWTQNRRDRNETFMNLNDLIEFAKSIPYNADLDFDSLKIEE